MSAPARVPPLDPAVLLAISLGGGLGALLRYLISTWWPTPPGHVPWATFVVNVTGCFAIGVLMVLVTEAWVTHRLLRPFAGAVLEALGYLAGTVLAALAGVVLGTGAARWATGAARR
ncbi:camphor resistance protein CrcB [Mycobacteroides abscessus subsp. abscessus]|nr:camphor resistance protein CrcB [Mycobacteroides abscessus subsp. abscessus]